MQWYDKYAVDSFQQEEVKLVKFSHSFASLIVYRFILVVNYVYEFLIRI